MEDLVDEDEPRRAKASSGSRRQVSTDADEIDEIALVRNSELVEKERLEMEREKMTLKNKMFESAQAHQVRMEQIEVHRNENEKERLRIENARLQSDIEDRKARIYMERSKVEEEKQARATEQKERTTLMAALLEQLRRDRN